MLKKVQQKQEAAGSEKEREAAEACSEAVRTAYRVYVQRVREELKELPKGSKKWWVKCKELSAQKSRVSNVPALKGEGGEWKRTAESKAQLLADTFEAKYKLKNPRENEYTNLVQAEDAMPDWSLHTEGAAEKF